MIITTIKDIINDIYTEGFNNQLTATAGLMGGKRNSETINYCFSTHYWRRNKNTAMRRCCKKILAEIFGEFTCKRWIDPYGQSHRGYLSVPAICPSTAPQSPASR
jgi:hypothetical protein